MRPRRAMSFVEVFLGILLLGIVLGPVLAAFSNLNRGTTSAMYELLASHYASELLEQVRVLPLPSLLEAARATSLAGVVGTLEIPVGEDPVNKLKLLDGVYLLYSRLPREIFGKRYLELRRIVKHAGSTEVHLLKVTVRVTWQMPGHSQPRIYEACTYAMEP